MAAEENQDEAIIVKKIIKKGGHGGHHGGAWKVAYADFVTAMMCLFLLLWLINVDPASKSAISSFFKQPTQTGPMKGNMFIFGGAKRPGSPGKMEGGASFLQFQKLKLTGQNKKEVQKKIQKELKEKLELGAEKDLLDKIEFNLVEKGIIIEIKDTDTQDIFQPGSAALTGEATNIIDGLAQVLKDKLSPIIVAGHTDGNTFSYGNYDNWNLSTDRAIAVKSRLVYSGVNKTRFARVEGYADTQLKNPEVPLSSANRRITLLMLQDGEKENLKPKYLNQGASLGKNVSAERQKESLIKKNNVDMNKLNAVRGKNKKPPSLDELRRKKARAAFRSRHPVKAAEAGGHGGGEEAAPESDGDHGGGGHGGGH